MHFSVTVHAVLHYNCWKCFVISSGEFRIGGWVCMLPLGFSPELDEGTTSRQFFVSCTGFLSRDVSTSSWHVLFTRLCPARHLHTWLTTYTCFRRSKTSTPLVHRQIVCCSMDAQHIWRQKLCCRRATSLEQLPVSVSE